MLDWMWDEQAGVTTNLLFVACARHDAVLRLQDVLAL